MNQPINYVSKASFDEVWHELQHLKASASPKITIIGFDEAYKVGVLHDRIRQLEAENECLRAMVENTFKE